MRSNRLGCLSGTGIFAAIVTSLVIAGYVYAQGGLLYNPGALNAQSGEMLGGVTSHAETDGDCQACHTAPWERAKMADRCVDCHGEIARQMQDVASLHGRMMHNSPDITCRHCHPEHRGADAPLTEMDYAEFPHEVVGYSLTGHAVTSTSQPFTCDGCHNGDITTFASDTCSTCHSNLDPVFVLAHSIEYGDACLDCHDGVDRFGKNFVHDAGFALTGSHDGLTCSKCHTGARTLVDFQNTPSDCYSCHLSDDPHLGAFGNNCAACHQVSSWAEVTFDHNLSGFPLTGGHAGLACEQCHVNSQFAGLSTSCVNCHSDPVYHAGMFGTDCASCHSTDNWSAVYRGSHPSIADEGGSGVNHGNTSCRTCHPQTLNSATCLACHDSNNPDDEGGGGEDGQGDDD